MHLEKSKLKNPLIDAVIFFFVPFIDRYISYGLPKRIQASKQQKHAENVKKSIELITMLRSYKMEMPADLTS